MIQTRPHTVLKSSEEDAVMSYGQSQDANGSLLLGVYEKLTSASGHARDASSSLVAKDPSVRACDSRDRNEMEVYNNTAGQAMTAPSKPAGGAKRGGRPVTWIGGGGLDAKKLAGLGVPMLRSLFNQVFGEPTASNNAGWLRRKLSESPDSVHGQRRSAIVRARDSGAAIWNSALPQVMPGGCGDGVDGMECDVMECDGEAAQEHAAGEEAAAAAGSALLAHYACDAGGRRSLKRSSTSAESADTLGYRGSGNNMHCPSSPSGSGSASPTGTQHGSLPGSGSASPRGPNRFSTKPHKHLAPTHHKHNNKGTSKPYSQYQTQQQQQGGQAGCVGAVIRPELFSDSYLGLKVMVYWPQDHKWWEATICKLHTATCELQLLYSDMTEEAVSGGDFIDLLTKGHLALAAGVTPPPAAAAAMATCAAAAAPVGVSGVPAVADVADVSWLDSDGASLATGIRSQSCLLPTAVCDVESSPVPIVRSASASFAGVGSGTGSGEASATLGGDIEELATKRQCLEVSGNAGSGSGSGSGSNGDINRPSSFGGFFPAACSNSFEQLGRQQLPVQQGQDACNLGAWFHAQQQQQLQMQMQAQQQNMQLQQQMHMQMQQQMAAHMAMQQAAAAAGQFVQQMQAPAFAMQSVGEGCPGMGVGAPMCLAPTATPAAAAAVAGVACSAPMLTTLPPVQTPFAAAMVASQQQQQWVGSPLAPGSSNMMLANDIEQLKQLQQRLRLAVSSNLPEANVPCWQPAADQGIATAAPAAATCAGTLQPQPQQGGNQYTTPPLASSIKVEPVASVIDQAAAQQQRRSASCDAAVVPDLGTAAAPPPTPAAPAADGYPANMQQVVADGNDIDCLLSKPGDIFDLSALEMEQTTELEAQMGDIDVLNDAIDMAEGSVAASDLSNSCDDSLCESLAEDLAVAGLDADAATAYYTYNMFQGDSTGKQGIDNMQDEGSGDLDSIQQGLSSMQPQGGVEGLEPQAGGFGPCTTGVQGSDGIESEFAHIFDD